MAIKRSNKINECIHCNRPTRYSKESFCSNCYNNPDVVIYHDSAKKKYHLTDNDLFDADIFSEQFKFHCQICTKYLWSEVHELARELSKDLDPNDRQVRRFQIMDIEYAEREKRFTEFNDKKKYVIQSANTLMSRYDPNADISNYPDIMCILHDLCLNTDESALTISTHIADLYSEQISKEKRKSTMGLFMESLYQKYPHIKSINPIFHIQIKEWLNNGSGDIELIKGHIDDWCKKQSNEINELEHLFKESNTIELPYQQKRSLYTQLFRRINNGSNAAESYEEMYARYKEEYVHKISQKQEHTQVKNALSKSRSKPKKASRSKLLPKN